MRWMFGAMICVATLVAAPAAFGQTRADLEKARAAYLARNYAEAEERLRVLVDSKTGFKERSLLTQARMNLGAVLLAQGKKAEADDLFEKLILEDPNFEPDPLAFPTDVLNAFIDVRAGLQEKIKLAAQNAARLEAERKAKEEAERLAQQRWLERVKAQAMEEKITVRNNRVVACLPFGAGQFQNRNMVLGFIFLGTEVAALVGTASTFTMYLNAREREQEEIDKLDISNTAEQYHQRAENIRYANLGFAGAFLAVAGLGILEANLSFVPEHAEKKHRDLPPVSKLRPTVAPLAGGGAFVGITGVTF
jgi:hypothetical protein